MTSSQLMTGKKGLIMGLANDHSLAWGIAKALHSQGAELAFTYQGEALQRRVTPLAESLNSKLILPCDVNQETQVTELFDQIGEKWNHLDFVVHAIGFSDKNELTGKYVDTSRQNFLNTLDVSCYSFLSENPMA